MIAGRDHFLFMPFTLCLMLWDPILLLRMEAWNLNIENDRGVCSLGMSGDIVKTCCIIRWLLRFLNDASDSKGAHFGSKTTMLEMIGLLLPLLTVPNLLVGKHAVFAVDNIAIWHGWKSRGISNDITASILIRAMFLFSYYLGCTIHVVHVPRISTAASELADALSRSSTTIQPPPPWL